MPAALQTRDQQHHAIFPPLRKPTTILTEHGPDLPRHSPAAPLRLFRGILLTSLTSQPQRPPYRAILSLPQIMLLSMPLQITSSPIRMRHHLYIITTAITPPATRAVPAPRPLLSLPFLCNQPPRDSTTILIRFRRRCATFTDLRL